MELQKCVTGVRFSDRCELIGKKSFSVCKLQSSWFRSLSMKNKTRALTRQINIFILQL